jgi:hypothetical protein
MGGARGPATDIEIEARELIKIRTPRNLLAWISTDRAIFGEREGSFRQTVSQRYYQGTASERLGNPITGSQTSPVR